MINKTTTTETKSIVEVTQPSIKIKVDALSSPMRNRYFVAYPMYGILAYEIVIHIKNKRGKGVWEKFLATSKQVNESTEDELVFYQDVTHAFDLTVEYSEYDITSTILDIRKKLEMETFDGVITDECMNLFKLLFLYKTKEVEVIIDDKTKKYLVYIPNIAVLIGD